MRVISLVIQPAGQAVWQPSTKSAVLTPGQPHGTINSFSSVQPGTGQRIGVQSLGRVVCVTVGQAPTIAVLVTPGSVVMLMMNDVVVEELNELRLDVLVGRGRKGSVFSASATGLALTMLHYR